MIRVPATSYRAPRFCLARFDADETTGLTYLCDQRADHVGPHVAHDGGAVVLAVDAKAEVAR